MQMLTGNLALHHGSITINGYDLIDQPVPAKSQIGYLPEHPPLYRDLSVGEYLHYGARLHRVPAQRIAEQAEIAMLRCDLQDVSRRLIRNLSKGFQQRVGIAQAILHQPPVIILDEPTVGLDPIQIINEGAIAYSAAMKQYQEKRYHIRLASACSPAQLEAYPLFSKVEVIDDRHFIVDSDAEAADITAFISEQQLGLTHFSEYSDSLESTFVSIVSGSGAGADNSTGLAGDVAA
jgi:ABC-type multidrug transport system ATPase subunit